MALFGLKVCRNAFQMIPNVSSFDVKKNWRKISTEIFIGNIFNRKFGKLPISYGFLDVIGRCASKNDS